MIGPVSSTGRAMMASLQQAIQKGMPPDQAIQYVKSMATQGVAPLTDLYVMMNQFQRLKQQPAQPPQTPPTIRDELNVMEQQQAAMNQGLGGMNAGSMENPSFAGGGIVAFANRGLVKGIDLSAATPEQLEMIIAGEDVDLARAALQERLNRSGYPSPSGLAERLGYTPEYFRTFTNPPGAFKYDPRPLPAYMYDEEGKVRKGDVTGGIAGTRYFSSSRGPTAAPAAAPAASATQSQVPGTAVTPYSSPDQAAAAFSRSLEAARSDSFGRPVAQTQRRETTQQAPRGVSGDAFRRLIEDERKRKFEEIPDTYSGEEKARIEKAMAGLGAEKKDAMRMALAQAGFGMAAAASRAGRQRTTGLGALAEGAIGGLQQYNAAQKELRQTERELNREMASLRRYQDEVARGERTRELAFEESKRDNIAALTGQQESNRIQLAQLASAAEDRRLTREQRQIERKEDLSLSEKTLQIRALEGQRDKAASLLKTTFDPKEQAKIQQAVNYYNDQIARLAGVSAFGGGSNIPASILGIVSKYQ